MLKPRYIYSVVAVIAWISFVYLQSGGFAANRIVGMRDWLIFAVTIAACFGLFQLLVSIFRNESKLLTRITLACVALIITILVSSLVYIGLGASLEFTDENA